MFVATVRWMPGLTVNSNPNLLFKQSKSSWSFQPNNTEPKSPAFGSSDLLTFRALFPFLGNFFFFIIW